MPIRVHTVYTKERLLGFNDFMAKSKRSLWVMIIVASVIVCIALALMLATGDFDSSIMTCVVIILVLDILSPFLYFVLPRMIIKKNKGLNMCIEYAFDVDSFSLQAENQYASENSTIQYAALSRVLKNKSELYLFISGQQAYIVDLSSLSIEQYGALKDIITARIPQKNLKWAD